MPAPGTVLQHRYRIDCAIGHGGTGTVYRATDQRLAHTVAVKQVRYPHAALQSAFEQEARLLAALRHPALPKVTDHFVESGSHFLVMEYVPGDDLATRMLRQREPLTVDEVLRWADQLLDVLTYLHTQNPPVIHRDIKPHNLKLDAHDNVILLDFGLAKGAPAHAPTDKPITGYSLHYAAPEQLRGEQTDARSDLYALAATLYDLLSTVKPPDARSRLTAIAAGNPDPLRSLRELNPAVSPALAGVIHQGLALARPERPVDAAAMRLALRASGGDATEIVLPPSDAPAPFPPHHLPAQFTSFVGRENEVNAVQRLLLGEGVRLVTLTGPGGIGKTRLALSVATRCLAHFADGVFFVSLAPIQEVPLVLSTIAQTLGLREVPTMTVLQGLLAHLQDKSLLLILDNFEQVVAAAPLVSDLLAACPRLKVLATSREALMIQGEQEFPVPALEAPNPKQLPPPDDLATYPAIKLFVQRAQSVKPGFTLNASNTAAVAEICRRLDGLPLAIELAAASIRLLSAQAVLARLEERSDLPSSRARDLPDRQRTLRASIGWSYDLLAADEKALFRRLSIFTGSFDLQAAESLYHATGLAGGDSFERIAALAGKSLLTASESDEADPRFTMLETLREFGLRQLAEAGELPSVREAHADTYYRLGQEATLHLWGATIATWVNRLDLDNDNLRAALSYYSAHPQGAERCLRLAGWLWRFWEIRGYIAEGRAWLDRALARRHEAPPSSLWLALHGAGNLAMDQSDYVPAKQHYMESLHLLQTLLLTLRDPEQIRDTRNALANTLINLGMIALQQGDLDQALALTEEAHSLHRQVNRKVGLALALNNLAMIHLHQGRYDLAEKRSAESLALYRELGDDRGIGWNLHWQGSIARARGQVDQAARLYQESRRLYEKLSNQADMAGLLFDLGELARRQGDYANAVKQAQAGLAIAHHLGNQKDIAEGLRMLAALAMAERGRPRRAALLLGAAATLQQAIGVALPPSEQAAHSDLVMAVGAALGADGWATAMAEGQTMTLDQAVAYALGDE